VETDEVDPAHESKAHEVVRAAEGLLGDDRFGGAWIDRTPSPPVIGIAAVDPSQRDVDSIVASAKDTGWNMQIVGVRYSRADLVGMLESTYETPLPGDAWVSIGWDPQFNAIKATLRCWDEEAVCWARERFPDDALMIVVHPGHWVGSSLTGEVSLPIGSDFLPGTRQRSPMGPLPRRGLSR
jgi:hypothetical protein